MISELRVGDWVLAADEKGTLRFSQVIMKTHEDPDFEQKFQLIQTKTGRNLTLTDTHLIYKAEVYGLKQDLKEIVSSKPVFAMNIKKGDFVLVNDEINGMMKDEVVSNDVVVRKGISAPVTTYGNIVVDDILASCYINYEHSFVHMIFGPFRWFHYTKNLLARITKMQNNGFF